MADGSTPPKRVFIKTYGCQMNVYDSDRMADILETDGYVRTDHEAEADLVVLNTCHIREKATEKVFSELGRIRKRARAKSRDPLIAVAGCVAQAEGAEIARRADNVDLVIGPQSYQNLPALLKTAKRGEALAFDVGAKFEALKQGRRVSGPTAFVSVQEGCDKFCAFCVVPYTRGAEVSRPVDAVVHEVRQLVQNGVCEITLLGQNVNAYHGQGPDGETWSLARLIRHLACIDGLARLRYTTSHPNDMDDDLIEAHGDVEQLMPYLHLPIQSGSDPILKAMNRRHTAEHYLRIIDRLKALRPDIALSSDFIVGFPGESDADFDATMDVVRAVGFASAFSFKYSPRPGTPAAEWETQVAEDIKDARLYALQALLNDQLEAFNRAQIGRTLPVLFDKPGKFAGQVLGRSPYLQPVHIVGSADHMGRILPVRITAATRSALTGDIADAAG